MPRRQLLKGAGALSLAAILRPTAVFAECDDEGERLGPFGPWSRPVNLGPVVNSRFHERRCAISKDGLSLYITSDRPGGVNGPNPPPPLRHRLEIWTVRLLSSTTVPGQTAAMNLVLRHKIAVGRDQHTKHLEGARPDRDRDEHLAFIPLEQAAPVETEGLE